jgi:hypothetical protein
MANFSQLCPLFNTGMYSEVTFPTIILANISTTTTIGPGIPFGRSVIVTHAYARRAVDLTAAVTYTMKLGKMAAWSVKVAAATIFASCKMSTTVTAYPVGRYKAFTVTAKTFNATDILVVQNSQKEAAMQNTDIIVRYKEK